MDADKAREIARRIVADFRPEGWPAKEEEIARYIAGEIATARTDALREAVERIERRISRDARNESDGWLDGMQEALALIKAPA